MKLGAGCVLDASKGPVILAEDVSVGANAVIRKKALDDIVEVEIQGGYEIKRYVQDRTVIEDTESSIDLGTHGWTLRNYPERLSYSATPPDFGSLIVQRRRWANGGLLILPKLWRTRRSRKARGEINRISETFTTRSRYQPLEIRTPFESVETAR